MRLRSSEIIFPYFLFTLFLALASCSDEKPVLGPEVIDPKERPEILSLNTDSMSINYSVTYIEYDSLTRNSTRFVIGNSINGSIGTLHANAALRLIADAEVYKPDSLVKILSAKISLTPYFVSMGGNGLPYYSGDTTESFHLALSELTSKTYFSNLRLKDDVSYNPMVSVADTTFTGTQHSTFLISVKDTNWVRRMITSMGQLNDTTLQYSNNMGLVLHSPDQLKNRTLGFYGFATNENYYNYDYEPRMIVKSLVKNGTKSDTITAYFSINSGNQLAKFTKSGPHWNDNSRIILAGLSGIRALVKFSDTSFLPSRVLFYKSTLSMTVDSTISNTIDSDYFVMWNAGADGKTRKAPGVFAQFGSDSNILVNVLPVVQYWSFNTNNGFFIYPSGELSRSEMNAIFLKTEGNSKKPSFTFIYSGL